MQHHLITFTCVTVNSSRLVMTFSTKQLEKGFNFLFIAPFSFSLLFKLIKPMLNEQIANKLVFFSNTHALHEGLLKENIANDVIPVELGGTYLPQ